MGVGENQRENEGFHKETRNPADSGLFTSRDKATGSSSGPTIYGAPDLADCRISLADAGNQPTHSSLSFATSFVMVRWSDATNRHNRWKYLVEDL